MGDNKKALMLIIRRLDDVQRVKMKKNILFLLFLYSLTECFIRLLILQKNKKIMNSGKIYLLIPWTNQVIE